MGGAASVGGAVGQHGLVFFVEQLLEHLAVMHVGRGGLGLKNKLGLHMVLPAIVGFVVLLRPTDFAVFLPTHGRVGVELLGPPAVLDALVLLRSLRWRGASVKLAVTPLLSSWRLKASKSLRLPSHPSASRRCLKSRIVLASGITPPMRRPRKFLKLVRSKICSSVASSLSPWNFCSTGTVNMSTGSKDGLPPLRQSRVA